eukprot:g13032.t1
MFNLHDALKAELESEKAKNAAETNTLKADVNSSKAQTNALKAELESEKAKNAAETNSLKAELASEKAKSIKLNNTIMELKSMVQTLAQQYASIHQECKANSTNQGRRLVTCGDSIAKRIVPSVIQPIQSTTVAPTVTKATTKASVDNSVDVAVTKASVDVVVTKASVDMVATETTTNAPRPTKDTRQDKLSAGKVSAHVSIVFVWMQALIVYNVL